MIDFAQQPPIIYTDHEAVVEISCQEFLSTSFIDKLNLRLIQAFKYIQRFNLIIKHKSRKKHIVSNALFRLKFDQIEIKPEEGELNALSASIQIRVAASA